MILYIKDHFYELEVHFTYNRESNWPNAPDDEEVDIQSINLVKGDLIAVLADELTLNIIEEKCLDYARNNEYEPNED